MNNVSSYTITGICRVNDFYLLKSHLNVSPKTLVKNMDLSSKSDDDGPPFLYDFDIETTSEEEEVPEEET
jgi:hypothetical protein